MDEVESTSERNVRPVRPANLRSRVPAGDPVRGYLGHAYGKAGRCKEAEEIAASSRYPFHQVLVFAGLGDKDRAIEALERMREQGAVRIGRTLVLPEVACLRGDPRVERIRKACGLR
jgi:hypothetical protein